MVESVYLSKGSKKGELSEEEEDEEEDEEDDDEEGDEIVLTKSEFNEIMDQLDGFKQMEIDFEETNLLNKDLQNKIK